MNDRLRAHFTELLLEERTRVAEACDRIRARKSHTDHEESPRLAFDEPSVGAAGGGPGDDDAIASREIAALEEIDATLRVLYNAPEDYGVCVTCHEPIDVARLELLPATRHCARDAELFPG